MKKNMKKLASLLFMAMLVLGLTACGSTGEPAATVVETGYAQEVADFLVENIAYMPVETMQMYVDMDIEEIEEKYKINPTSAALWKLFIESEFYNEIMT